MSDTKLTDFVRIWDNVVPDPICDMIVDAFEEDSDHHVESFVGESAGPDDREYGQGHADPNGQYRNAIEMNVVHRAEENPRWKNIVNILNNITRQQLERYRNEMTENGFPPYMLPKDLVIEDWRMHRYDPGKHYFKDHIDSCDLSSASRYLGMLYYPATVDEGGETAFTWHLEGVECKPKKGRLLIFPTWFGFPHEAKVPISNSKYLIKTFLHYPGIPPEACKNDT